MAAVEKGASPPNPRMMTAIVARGRTLVLNGHRHGPGSVVELSVDEHAHLLAHGFLRDPRIVPPAPAAGLKISGAAGNVVRSV